MSMDNATREALEGSIDKWQAIVGGSGVDKGADNFPLCTLFNNTTLLGDEEKECIGCPVRTFAKASQCVGTPYWSWVDLHNHLHPYRATTPEQKAAAQAELDFLISLRPKD